MRKGDKFDQGKPMMRFLSKEFLDATAKAQTYGANKYGPWNYQKGLETSALYDATIRHLIAWYSGEENDPESNESHLGHAAANINMLLWTLNNKPEMDDRPHLASRQEPPSDPTSKLTEFPGIDVFVTAASLQKRGR